MHRVQTAIADIWMGMIKIQNRSDRVSHCHRNSIFCFRHRNRLDRRTIHRFFCLFSRRHTADAVHVPLSFPDAPVKYAGIDTGICISSCSRCPRRCFRMSAEYPLGFPFQITKVIHIKYFCQLVRIFFLGHSRFRLQKNCFHCLRHKFLHPDLAHPPRRILNRNLFIHRRAICIVLWILIVVLCHCQFPGINFFILTCPSFHRNRSFSLVFSIKAHALRQP